MFYKWGSTVAPAHEHHFVQFWQDFLLIPPIQRILTRRMIPFKFSHVFVSESCILVPPSATALGLETLLQQRILNSLRCSVRHTHSSKHRSAVSFAKRLLRCCRHAAIHSLLSRANVQNCHSARYTRNPWLAALLQSCHEKIKFWHIVAWCSSLFGFTCFRIFFATVEMHHSRAFLLEQVYKIVIAFDTWGT